MISQEDKQNFEAITKKALEKLPPKAAPITHHGDGNIFVHTGEGDIHSQNNEAEMKKLRAKVKILEECISVQAKDYKELLAAKNVEINLLKDAITLHKETIQSLKEDLQRYKPYKDLYK